LFRYQAGYEIARKREYAKLWSDRNDDC
jgi:hypothetical protein